MVELKKAAAIYPYNERFRNGPAIRLKIYAGRGD